MAEPLRIVILAQRALRDPEAQRGDELRCCARIIGAQAEVVDQEMASKRVDR